MPFLESTNTPKGKVWSIGKLDINSPVILGLTAVSLVLLILDIITMGFINRMISIYYVSWLNPFQYLRLFTHVLGHASVAHYAGNFLLILAIGPMVEEKYGSKNLLIMFAITAVATGLVETILFPRTALIGASGLAFMLILLASFVNVRSGRIPITALLVGVLYIGNEVVTGLINQDNVSQLAHIVGGLCGAAFGFYLNFAQKRKESKKTTT